MVSEHRSAKLIFSYREMAMVFELLEGKSRNIRVKQGGGKPFFTLEGKIALAFLKMHSYLLLSLWRL